MPLEKQFTQVIKANEAIIFKISTVYTRTKEDQQDLYQDIIIQLWKTFVRFRNEAQISTWIYRIALNTAITRLRKTKKRATQVPIDQAVLQYTENTDPEFEARIKLLYSYIETLNDLDKGIILLYLEDKSHGEIAGIIGLSVTNVGTRISRIRKKMKTQFAQK